MAFILRSNDPTNDQPVTDLLNLLGRCMGFEAFLAEDGTVTRTQGPPLATSQAFTDIFDKFSKAEGTVTITVGKGQSDVIFDNYERREVDVDDIKQLPELAPPDFPSTTTRCEILLHILGEYGFALQRARLIGGDGYNDAHEIGGFDAQNRQRAANGQQGTIISNKGRKDSTGKVIAGFFTYSNGASTIANIRDGNVTTITPREPPP